MRDNDTTRPRAASAADVAAELKFYFRRNGYVRRQRPQRLEHSEYWPYKKGEEVRLTSEDEQELLCIQNLLQRAGFRPGRPFEKRYNYCLPLHGREEVQRFLDLIGEDGEKEVVEPDEVPKGVAAALVRKSGKSRKRTDAGAG